MACFALAVSHRCRSLSSKRRLFRLGPGKRIGFQSLVFSMINHSFEYQSLTQRKSFKKFPPNKTLQKVKLLRYKYLHNKLIFTVKEHIQLHRHEEARTLTTMNASGLGSYHQPGPLLLNAPRQLFAKVKVRE